MNHIKVAIADEQKRIEKIRSGKCDAFGLKTGLPKLDRILWGLRNGMYYLLAARPGIGKTTLALNVIENVTLQEKKCCLFISLEMTQTQIVIRVACNLTGIDGSTYNDLCGLTDGQLECINRVFDKVAESDFHIEDNANFTTADIWRMAKQMKKDGKLDLVVIDQITFMTPIERASSRAAEVSAISRQMKILGKDLDIPVLALTQLNRDTEKNDRKPILSDLRDSGSLEQDADVVIFLHPTTSVYEPTYDLDIIIAKNRHGAKAMIKANMNGAIYQIKEYPDENKKPPKPRQTEMTPVPNAELPWD